MGGGLYSIEKKEFDKNLDLTRLKPYGDTMNDGKIQVSFTLPVKDGEKAMLAAENLSKMMGLDDPHIVYHSALDEGFTFFIIYGTLKHTIDYTMIKVNSLEVEVMSFIEINTFIKEQIGRKIVVIGATTGTDAHTVGLDAIMNVKGFAGHYGLESFNMIEAHNLGSQVTNEEFVKKAIDLKADVLLVSQTVTQKDIHVKNLTNLVDLLEAENLRDQIILICGGPRISNELAKELGYDAGFGAGTYADIVATYFIKEIVKREKKI
jgi:beta-lysine 5,6-aminomutase beta subunit